MSEKKQVKIYRLKIVYTEDEIIHLDESIDGEGQISFNIEGEDVLIPDELAEMISALDHDILGLS